MAVLDITLWIVQFLLAGLYLMAGSMKAFQYEKAREKMPWVSAVPRNLVLFIGGAEILGAIGLVVPMLLDFLPWLTVVAAFGLVLVQAIAIPFHVRRGETKVVPLNAVLLLLAAFVAIGRLL